ncbi:serine protease Do [Polynucleobacter meluiroseus]|uniref:Probable periplasmic serine endoprotease DegP-like n=1 Tax=Polynucleobacter meluiroseus TaxID=1938814 RepID=A0A240E119_9BURK|nr:DegQ family serine endoprotease [Polynucleobacter meluiroseus]SNX28201.1 serine protease Do [Polynucleobacter meluiroseus]
MKKHLISLLTIVSLGQAVFISSALAQSPRVAIPDFADLVERASPAVVNIRTTEKVMVQQAQGGIPGIPEDQAEFFRRFFGVPIPGIPNGSRQTPQNNAKPQEADRGVGSGFIMESNGLILTNAHVVEGANTIYVMLTDKREFKAKLLGMDKRTDVAVIKIEARDLPRLPLGDSSKLRVGEWVLAIGSPFGLDNTVTAGIVSAKSRDTGDYLPFIQTDVAVNPGNSGGPLVNTAGQVVGINSQIFSRSGGYMGISFAIPIDEAMRVADQLRSNGKMTRGRIGVALGDMTKEVAESLGLGKPRGAYVRNVEPGGPAALGGVESGDVILSFNGRDIAKSTDLPRLVGETKPGSSANLQVWRKGASRDLTVVVIDADATAHASSKKPEQLSANPASGSILGVTVNEVSDLKKRELNIRNGVEVVSLNDGPLERAGIRPGDVIIRLADNDITGVKQFEALLKGLDAGKSVPIFIRRADSTLVIPIKLK